MLEKNKNEQSKLTVVAENIGMTVLALATVINMAELSGHEGHNMFGFLQPAYASVGQQSVIQDQSSELRRGGREEIRHTSASYGAVMRSHSITGSL